MTLVKLIDLTVAGKNRLSKIAIASSVISVSLLALASVQAANVNLNFNTLPSTQGWTYSTFGTNSVSETDVFSISNDVLTQNTVGTGDAINYYALANVVDTDKLFTLSWRSRVIQDEFVLNPKNFFGFGVTVNGLLQRFTIGSATDKIGIAPFQALPGSFDNTVFHNYRLEGSFITGNADFYIDNVLTANITLLNGVTDNATDGLAFGDLTGYTNALAEITSYSFTQSAIPEPSSILGLLAFGILGIGTQIKRKPNP